MIPALLFAAALDYTRQSLLATYRHYTEAGAEIIEREDANSTIRTTYPQRAVRRVVTRSPRPVARDYDPLTGRLIREVPLFFNAKGRVFEVNPVAKLNAPQLRDQNNAASAVPETAYAIVDLLDLPASGVLAGPNVRIIDVQDPATSRADAGQSLMFDRGQPQFEEVNVYYAIDRSQRYLQSLGYTGARRIVGYAIPVDPHALGGSDNSIYESSTVPGQGGLFFGDGGTDDAEDPDIVLHEYTHAMQDWIAPGAFFGSSGSEARALAEGIADYWGFSQNYEQTAASGRDPYCLGDWDARCDGDDPSEQCGYPPGADCLRRVDSAKTMADFRAIERSGQEHENSAIWSSALREIFEALRRRHPDGGRQLSDRIVIESMFGIPNNPTFALLAHNMFTAASALSPNDTDVVCSAMTGRGITIADCVPRGEVTLFQSSTPTLTINDGRFIVRMALIADVTGSLVLIAPDGTRVSPDNLASLAGRSILGTWTLEVTGGTLRSWSLLLYAGDPRFTERPVSTAQRTHIAAVAHTAGENGTNWRSDVRLLNRGDRTATVKMVYTPEVGGFGFVRLVITPKQVMALNDVVGTFMQSPGTLGSLEFQGDLSDLVITSRTYTEDSRGTFGQFIPGVTTSDAFRAPEHGYVTHLRNDADFRSNVGFSEVQGRAGVISVNGTQVSVAPYGHVQMPVSGSGDIVADFSIVSGEARILAYGSMIDNKSGDAIYVPARMPLDVARTEYAPAISAPGAFGTQWSTEVMLTGSAPTAVAFKTTTATLIPPFRISNFLRDSLGIDDTIGLLRLTVRAGSLASARIWTPSDGGTYGQFVPFRPPGHGGDLIQLEVSDAFRTNLGLANTGDAPALARFTAFDAAGTVLSSGERVLQSQELVQFPLTVNAARVRVEGDVLAYASVVDNRSGDAIFVPAQ